MAGVEYNQCGYLVVTAVRSSSHDLTTAAAAAAAAAGTPALLLLVCVKVEIFTVL